MSISCEPITFAWLNKVKGLVLFRYLNESVQSDKQTITDETYIYLNFEKPAPGGGGGEEQRLTKVGEYVKPSLE